VAAARAATANPTAAESREKRRMENGSLEDKG